MMDFPRLAVRRVMRTRKGRGSYIPRMLATVRLPKVTEMAKNPAKYCIFSLTVGKMRQA